MLVSACGPRAVAPSGLIFDGLPVSGSYGTARATGFDRCARFTNSMRCQRDEVVFAGAGPFRAAVDLRGSEGTGGFDQLILWHPSDQYAVVAVGDALDRRGWRSCYTTTANGAWGDQKVYSHPRSPVTVALDMSYWLKRRVRVMPNRHRKRPRC